MKHHGCQATKGKTSLAYDESNFLTTTKTTKIVFFKKKLPDRENFYGKEIFEKNFVKVIKLKLNKTFSKKTVLINNSIDHVEYLEWIWLIRFPRMTTIDLLK